VTFKYVIVYKLVSFNELKTTGLSLSRIVVN